MEETEIDIQSPEVNHGIEMAQSVVTPQRPEKEKGVSITTVKTKLRKKRNKIMNTTTCSLGGTGAWMGISTWASRLTHW